MRTIWLLSCLLTASGLMAGCRKSTPAPAARYTHTHTFNTVLGVVPPEREQIEQPAASLRGTAQLTSTALTLTVAADPDENLTLQIPRASLSGDFTGQYPLRDPTLTGAGLVEASYTYWAPTSTGRQPQRYQNTAPATSPCSGSVQITKYDARHGLISGNYHVDYSFVAAPRGSASTNAIWQITLTGSFENVELAQ